MVETVEVLVEGGKATAGPPIGPALGPLGLNIMEVVQAINEKTASFEGMKVPVRIVVDPEAGTFELEIGTPPTSALILKELGLEKGSSAPRRESIGDLSLDQVIKIAQMKAGSTLGPSPKEKVLEVLGTCLSVGVTVEGRDPKELQREILEGKWDSRLPES